MPYCYLDYSQGFFVFDYPDNSTLHLPNTELHRKLLASIGLVPLNLHPDPNSPQSRMIPVWMNPNALVHARPTHSPDQIELFLSTGSCVYSQPSEWLKQQIKVQAQ